MSLQFELKSAFSVKISWDSFNESDTYTVQWTQSSVQKKTTVSSSAIALVNLEPDTSYDVRVTSASSSTVLSDGFQTWSLEDPHLENLYTSVRLEDGTYDATQFDKSVHDVFLKYFNNIVQNGDTIYASVILKGAPKNIETRAVTEGSTTDVAGDQNLFLPFSKDSGSAQIVTLSNSVPIEDVEATSVSDVAVAQDLGGAVELLYTPESDTFTIGNNVYGVGDKFNLFGKMVTVADGSIVLVFEDTVAKVYPFTTTTASNVVGTLGSQFAKNYTCNVMNVVGSKTTGASGETYSSSWVYDTAADTIAEATRIVHTIDEDSANGTISIGVRHTDANSNTFIEPVVACASGSTTISAQDDSDNTVSTTIDPTGISFDTDDACIYFGAAQKFRIIFRDGTPSTLAIESYDADSGTYMTRSEFSDSS
ncbi:EsV-1-50 [Ectocarpus siliculosus]|uniref:EsV-1-50 n=1 Tax=Ectocarpus siliculosus TaxID=2880 RepID=D8LP83_ECTSI|nr:EsV-1-50 [Ectocarpus siliculosus]|eukprot:CBN80354.1 EsV-1-50 [Ectocarpus siliculosus]